MALSHYLRTSRDSVLRRLGCAEGWRMRRQDGRAGAMVVLAFGKPVRRWGAWGASLFGSGFRSTARIRRAGQAYAEGYLACGPGSGRPLRIALGTSNFGPSVSFGHGRAWARMVNEANEWAARHGHADRVEFAGASDIELAWNGPRVTKAWVRGYESAARWPYYDFGDAADCPPRGNCLGRWTPEDVWYVAWGAPHAWPLPEVYASNGVMARQWYRMSLYAYRRHGRAMAIRGVMSQRGACRQAGPCPGLGNSPRRAWRQLSRLLNRDPRTAQDVPWATDIRWQH